jgi:uncharacterized integral membrane protein
MIGVFAVLIAVFVFILMSFLTGSLVMSIIEKIEVCAMKRRNKG